MCAVCIHVWPPWQRGSCHSCEASRHFSLEPDVLDCAPRGASPHPGTCTSADTKHRYTKPVNVETRRYLFIYLKTSMAESI